MGMNHLMEKEAEKIVYDFSRFFFCFASQNKYGEVHAYCLMSNHIHLLIRSNGSDISQFMK